MSAETAEPIPVQIVEQCARLLEDQKRVRVSIGFSGASLDTTVSLELLSEDQRVISSASILGVLNNRVDFTLHTGKQAAEGALVVSVQVTRKEGELLLQSIIPVETPV